jgi:hypothetical protein
MKKLITLILLIMILTLLVSCQPKLSSDSFDTLDIFNENKTFVYEKSLSDEISEIVYNLVVDGNIAKVSTTIKSDDGEYRSSSSFERDTLQPVKSYKGNTHLLYPEKNWDVNATYNELLDMEAVVDGENEHISLVIPEYILDNEGLIFTVGAIAEKDLLVINVVSIDTGDILPYEVSWLGEDTIETTYGKYDCTRIRLKYTGIVLGEKPVIDLWYTKDDNRYLIKYSNGRMELILKESY